MKWVANYVWMSAFALMFSGVVNAGNCVPCGGCSDPCASGSASVSAGSGCAAVDGCGAASMDMSGASAADCGNSLGAPASERICETVKGYKVVMESQYVTETRAVCVQETRNETRYRTKTVYRTVPVVETKYRSNVVNVPKTETKTINYSVLVPVKSEKTVEVTESVPVWNEVPEEYTVRVPQLTQVPDQYTVKVAQLQDETFTYTVNVPQAVTEQRVRTVINAVPVTKTRTIQVCVPTTTMQTVTKDYGHWEDQLVEVPAAPAAMSVSDGYAPRTAAPASARRGLLGRLLGHHACGSVCGSCGSSACGGCQVVVAGCGGGCGTGCGAGNGAGSMGDGSMGADAGCGTTTMTKKVWVPNVVTETVPVTTSSTQEQVVHYTVYEQEATSVPYECTTIVYQPEVRTGTKKTVVYVDEPRTRMRTVVQYNDEKRTRMRKELTYTNVTKSITVPHVTYVSEPRTKEVSYTYNVPEYTMEPYETTRYDRVCEEQVEEYTVCVPYTVVKEEKVQVCKMVPRVVEEVFSPCCDDVSSPSGATGCGCGAATAPVSSGAGCGCGAAAPAAPEACGCGAPAGAPCGC